MIEMSTVTITGLHIVHEPLEWKLFTFLLHALVGLPPNEAVTVQLQRVRVALALEEARKIAPLGYLSHTHTHTHTLRYTTHFTTHTRMSTHILHYTILTHTHAHTHTHTLTLTHTHTHTHYI